jgi:hypothetical protein
MAERMAGIRSSSEASRGDTLLATILAVAASFGLCMAFSLGYWVRALIDGDRNSSGASGSHSTLREGGATADPVPALAANLEWSAVVQPPVGASSSAVPLPRAASEKQPVSAAPAPTDPHTQVAGVYGPAAPEPFDLGESTSRPSAPFIIPDKPWFALADLKVDGPAVCDRTQHVCAADRSLNTALTWASSPKEAAARAKADRKLVFLMQVSGNFEDPGFT